MLRNIAIFLTLCVIVMKTDSLPHYDECKRCPGLNEKWYDDKKCPDTTCENPYSNIDCSEYCIPGCYCIENYVRLGGICVLEQECPPTEKCPRMYEVWYDNHPGRDGTCDDPNPECDYHVEGCFCRKGCVRNEFNHCIPYSQCCHYHHHVHPVEN